MIPDFLHKSLLAPLAIAKVVDAPELLPPLFESNIKASHIYAALNQPALYDQQQCAIESYIRSKPIFMWEGSIFSEEFVNYTSLYRPYYKALYLLALFKLPSGSPIYSLLEIIGRKLSNAQAYIAENEQHILCLPQAMLHLEIPPVECYKIGTFCYKWEVNNLNLTFKNLWEGYEERFLSLAAAGNIPNAQFRLGIIATYKGNYQNAELFLRQAASQAHTNAQYELGLLLLEQSKVLEAETFLYQAAIKNHLFAHFALAQLWFQQGHLGKATSSFRTIAEQASSATLYNLVQLLPRDAYLKELDLFYRQIVSYTPFAQLQVLSTLLLSKNDPRQIDPFYRQVLNYGKTDIQYLLAELLNKRGSTTLADILLQEIIDRKEA
ncbi:MAG: sel1 repeat family protein [Alphaproteobacteria bacterium]|nr:sel1 repeat family protein [Alphaproteobacteria bacterium]